MTKNIRDIPQPPVPWWRVMIKGFYGLEIKPCKVIGFILHDKELIFPCEPRLATFWTVFGLYQLHGVSGGTEALERFSTKSAAQAFHDQLLADYPNLSGTPPQQPRGNGNFVFL